MRYDIWDGVTGDLLHQGVTFNHAVGALYRSQPFGHADIDVFEVQRRVHAMEQDRCYANVGMTVVTQTGWRSLLIAIEATRILHMVGHFE